MLPCSQSVVKTISAGKCKGRLNFFKFKEREREESEKLQGRNVPIILSHIEEKLLISGGNLRESSLCHSNRTLEPLAKGNWNGKKSCGFKGRMDKY